MEKHHSGTFCCRNKAELSDDPAAEKDEEESSRELNSESTLINGISILLAFLEARKQQAMDSAANHQSAGEKMCFFPFFRGGTFFTEHFLLFKTRVSIINIVFFLRLFSVILQRRRL